MHRFQVCIALILASAVYSWKTCEEVAFCKRHRDPELQKYGNYSIIYNSITVTKSMVQADLVAKDSTKVFKFHLSFVKNSFRVLIDDPNDSRYRILEALDGEPAPVPITHNKKDDELQTLTVEYENNFAIVYTQKFKVEFYHDKNLISTINGNDRLVFESTADLKEIALDVSFPNVHRAYGIPEHAERLSLRTTTRDGLDPYRHFNLDYGHYKIISTESLYGTVPILYAHGINHTAGLFWLNSAQTWIDVTIGVNHVDAFFMSETGALELFILTGPTLADAVKQYANLTGVAPLPQYFALGYHQSRYSYMTQEEVLDVVENFDTHDLPVDVMWLDIDYTQGKRYFTWDKDRFSRPLELLNNLTETNRKLVAIIDPHIKSTDNEYDVHVESTKNNYYVKRKTVDGLEDYVGECWPGLSSYLDFLNPAAMEYYASLYQTRSEFNHSNMHLWNDMNEPAVFNIGEHENTMAGDLLHNNGTIEHREVHNVYGFFQTVGTYRGLIDRGHDLRPFILTRSHFAGGQRYAAIWTGDNKADWEYLRISIPMCLTEALAGFSFCGADVGGFAGVPDEELYQRWYQAGVWLPFFRAHSAIDVPRREPYLYPEPIRNRVRKALQQRYAHLPVWYTLFWEHQRTGEPVIRPLTYHYQQDYDALSLDAEILVGRDILAAPVLRNQTVLTAAYLPGGKNEIWYSLEDNFKRVEGTGYHFLKVDMDSVPVFYRGGSIIPRKDTPKPSTVDTWYEPFTLYICPDVNNEAHGTLYIDDYETFKYKDNREYLYIQFDYVDNVLGSKLIDENTNFTTNVTIDKIVLVNSPGIVSMSFSGEGGSSAMHTTYDERNVSYIYNVSASLNSPFKINLELRSSSATVCANIVMIVLMICFILY